MSVAETKYKRISWIMDNTNTWGMRNRELKKIHKFKIL